jgi:hypothetical protein
MLASIIAAKAGDPRPAFCTFSVADRASRRYNRPVGLAPLRQFGTGGTAVDLDVFDSSGHAKFLYGKYTEMM